MAAPGRIDTRYYPAWGPYSKEHAGFSRRVHDVSGYRLDCIVVPGIYRGRVFVPGVIWDSGCIVTGASTDLRSVRWLHEMTAELSAVSEWQAVSERTARVSVQFTNRGDLPIAASCNLLLRMAPPRLKPGSDSVRMEVRVPEEYADRFTPAATYESLDFARPRITDNLVYDGYRRGIEAVQGSVRGRAVAAGWGREPGDRCTIRLSAAPGGFRALGIRYFARGSAGAALRVSLTAPPGDLPRPPVVVHAVLPEHENFAVYTIPLGDRFPDGTVLELHVMAPSDGLCIDGFFCLDSESEGVGPDLCSISLPHDRPAVSQAVDGGAEVQLVYESGDAAQVRWDGSYDSVLRSIETRHLSEVMAHLTHNHVSHTLRDQRHPPVSGLYEPWYLDLFLRPVDIGPRDSVALEFEVDFVESGPSRSADLNDTVAIPPPSSCVPCDVAHAPPTIREGVERLASVALTNVVYPVQIRGQYMCHTTPGRFWDSVYTWDAGFAGLGLSVISPERARESLDTYLGDEHDEHRAFLHHGSPVPVQAYLAKELLDLDPGHPDCVRDYRRLCRYYEFLIGRLGSSATNPFRTGLRTTFAYFYNSGGWDDYPAQSLVHARGIAHRVAPVVTNAHLVRFARLLTGFARALSDSERVEVFEADTREIMGALREHSWDEDESVFGYVEHSPGGDALSILRTAHGENANLGLDGISPLVTGLLLPSERDGMVERLFDPKHLWTDCGVSTVDLSAGYARRDGYWNGAIWMPHQWFLWKTCLDLGLSRHAWQIARTALELWAREVQASGRCYEHFPLSSGRGAGWHQFAGLSSPVLNWFAAYYQRGTVTPGFDTWVRSRSARPDSIHVSLEVEESSGAPFSSILVSPPRTSLDHVRVVLNGTEIGYTVYGQALSIDLRPGTHDLLVSYEARETAPVSRT